jgi:cytochrome b subunit of formate dehydrogenase
MDVYFPSHMAQGNDPSPSGMFKVFKTFSWGNHRLTGAIMERKWILVDYTGTQLLLYIYILRFDWWITLQMNILF